MKGYSIHVGVNYLDRNYYYKSYRHLSAANKDAKRMRDLAIKAGFTPNEKIFLNHLAKRDDFFKSLEKIGKYFNKEDTLLFTFSGHGASFTDKRSGIKIQSMCFYDGFIREDELRMKLSEYLPSESKVLWVSDCCHAGGLASPSEFINKVHTTEIIKQLPESEVNKIIKKNENDYSTRWGHLIKEEETTVSIKLLAACKQTQKAIELKNQYGYFTESLIYIWNKKDFIKSYKSFIKEIHQDVINPLRLPKPKSSFQEAALENYGPTNNAFDNSKPFSIQY